MEFLLYNKDCLEFMKEIPDESVDFILTDPPYGTTGCKWDTIIPFDLMWLELNRIIKTNGVVALFGSEPFSSKLRLSNVENFKYDWIWVKGKTGFQHCKNRPLQSTENISTFCKVAVGHKSLNDGFRFYWSCLYKYK